VCLSTVIGTASGGLGRGVPGGNSVGYTISRARTVTILSYPLLSPSATPSIAYATLSIAPMEGAMDRLLTIGQVAKRLRVSVDVVRSLTDNGQLRAERTGGRHRRYRSEEVERYRAKGRAPARDPRTERATKMPRPVERELG